MKKIINKSRKMLMIDNIPLPALGSIRLYDAEIQDKALKQIKHLKSINLIDVIEQPDDTILVAEPVITEPEIVEEPIEIIEEKPKRKKRTKKADTQEME